jgi:glycosyltransferase involved in cell wall biosynthesis|tara:strand:- start:722 stop:1738 length:1017 start_codon:yes stop_codon:yes gene_type:complete
MNPNKKLVIISKEKIYKKDNNLFCDNVDMKTIPEGLSRSFEVSIIASKSNILRFYKINLEKIEIASNIFTFLFRILKTFKNKQVNYLLVSITPYTFFTYLLLSIFRKKIFVYLRSNGYEEYKAILGPLGPLIYHIMYISVTFKSSIITCQKKLVKKQDFNLVMPSELDTNWLKSTREPSLDKPRLLYVGRIKIEKGVFSLFKIFNEIAIDAKLSVVGNTKHLELKNKKINLLGFKNTISDLIKAYDDHNITILPSFTEAHPKVVDESLARMRPVIIFEEIGHIIQNRSGIFISKRNAKSLLDVVSFILSNYSNIQGEMKNNKLPTKLKFISQMAQILN